MSGAPPLAPASLARRLASGLYDLLLNVALAMVATFPFVWIFGDSTQGWRRHLLQAWVLVVIGAYYVVFWTRGGQTLPMKTWRIRLVRADTGGPVNPARAVHRYVLAVLGLTALGLGFAWALFDRDGRFLHDRLAGTTLVESKGPG
ncbi:MAG TPA: RDD family protein [Usitatibacter sp.]|nr:RDD family protein [Usitatibacter sp.]